MHGRPWPPTDRLLVTEENRLLGANSISPNTLHRPCKRLKNVCPTSRQKIGRATTDQRSCRLESLHHNTLSPMRRRVGQALLLRPFQFRPELLVRQERRRHL